MGVSAVRQSHGGMEAAHSVTHLGVLVQVWVQPQRSPSVGRLDIGL